MSEIEKMPVIVFRFMDTQYVRGVGTEVWYRIVSWRETGRMHTGYSTYSCGDTNWGYRVAVEREELDAIGNARWTECKWDDRRALPAHGAPEPERIIVHALYKFAVNLLSVRSITKFPALLYVAGPDYFHPYRVAVQLLGGLGPDVVVETNGGKAALGEPIWTRRDDERSVLNALAGLAYNVASTYSRYGATE